MGDGAGAPLVLLELAKNNLILMGDFRCESYKWFCWVGLTRQLIQMEYNSKYGTQPLAFKDS